MKILCEQEILKLIKGAKEGQEKALENLIEYYRPYIISKCSKYNINGFDFENFGDIIWEEEIKEGIKAYMKNLF